MSRSMGDSAYPPGSYPGVDAWAFYIGGNTPHVWTDQEVRAIPCRYRLPILTRSTGGDPSRDAAALISWCRAHNQPPGTLTALDFEDRIDPVYLRAYDAAVNAAGWLVAVYGQQSTILGNPRPSGGYWVANWDRDASVSKLAAGWAARQYAGDVQLGHPWDLSVVADATPLWDTQGVPEMEQTDKVNGTLSRGNTVGDVLADATSLRDQWYLAPGVDSKNPPPAGSRFNLLFGQLADIQAKVTAIAGGLDPKALAASLAAALQPAITEAIQAGIAPGADQLAVVIEQHLAAALAAAK